MSSESLISKKQRPPELAAFVQNSPMLQARMDHGGTTWREILNIFKWKNKFNKQLGTQEQMKETGSCIYFPCFFPQSVVLPKIWYIFCQFCDDLGKKSNWPHFFIKFLGSHYLSYQYFYLHINISIWS